MQQDLDAAAAASLAKAQRHAWYNGAVRVHFGRCEICDRCRDADDRPLLVARQPRRRKFECFRCWLGLPVRPLEASKPEAPPVNPSNVVRP